tara:strand:- start:127 stop:363 length:237 start_codon:yes stop_codon:yes gene_type:complete
MGQAIRGVVPYPVSPSNSEILERAAKFNVDGLAHNVKDRGPYGHGKATRLYWSPTANKWIRLQIKNARKGQNKVQCTK